MKFLIDFFRSIFIAFLDLLELLLIGIGSGIDLFIRDCYAL
jgi:hypothetical protein